MRVDHFNRDCGDRLRLQHFAHTIRLRAGLTAVSRFGVMTSAAIWRSSQCLKHRSKRQHRVRWSGSRLVIGTVSGCAALALDRLGSLTGAVASFDAPGPIS